MESVLHHKGEKSDTLPGILFTIQVDFEVYGVEVDDWSVGIEHELSPRFRYMRSAACRKH